MTTTRGQVDSSTQRSAVFESKAWYRAPAGALFAVLSALGIVSACGADDPARGPTAEGQADALAAPVTISFQNGALPAASYAGSTDATIRQRRATTGYGGATTCEVDGDDDAGSDKSCLVRFGLSGIPAGSTVQSATITVRILEGSSNTYDVHEVKRSWDESDVTWRDATDSATWSRAGALGSSDRGNLVGTVSGGTGSKTITLNSAGIALVQAWVDGRSNNGIVISHPSNTNGMDFASSEHGNVSYRPKLTITYLPPGSSSGGEGSGGGGSGSGGDSGSGGNSGNAGGATDRDLLIAFIGDQGNNGNADAVLRLIKEEGAVATVHNGDFDYASNPTAWNRRIDNILGRNYPYFAVVGNHDADAWGGSNGYASYIRARHERVPEMNCRGELGVKATCKFRGLHLVQSCVGTDELRSSCGKDSREQVGFIRDSLAEDDSIWSMCVWHKNQNDMQVGGKPDDVGWNAYKECMNAGAIVSTGHEHSYSRTRTLTKVGDRGARHGVTGAFDTMEVGAAKTFVFVSGLGGKDVRDYEASAHDDDTWWASYYASNRWVMNGETKSGRGTHGALFIRFNVGGDPRRATGYFKDVNGRLADEFTIRAR